MASFVHTAWSTPESKLSAADFCKVCLIDQNKPGKKKIKVACKLPIRSTPGGPYNTNALRAAAAALAGARTPLIGVSAAEKRKAARTLVRLMRMAKMNVGPSILKMAGMK